MRISDWSSDVCSSDLRSDDPEADRRAGVQHRVPPRDPPVEVADLAQENGRNDKEHDRGDETVRYEYPGPALEHEWQKRQPERDQGEKRRFPLPDDERAEARQVVTNAIPTVFCAP